MQNGVASAASRDFRALFEAGSFGGLSDGQLLDRFVARREEAVFEAIIHRHGPMVWGVCRRILRDHHDAEDAFQAAFLVLARKSASVNPSDKLGNWLYGVAHQTSVKARAMRTKRRLREVEMQRVSEAEATRHEGADDRLSLLDRELSRLPDKHRILIVLCELEGKTHREAAERLGWPIGTVSGRLSRARSMLARRLSRRAAPLSIGSLAAFLAQESESACITASLTDRTARAASLIAAGRAVTAGTVPAGVVTLMEGVMRTMLLGKLKALAVMLLLGFVATGTAVLTHRTAAARGEGPPTAEGGVETSRKQEPVKEAFTAWGKEVGGLQAGLGYQPGQRRAYSYGETVRLVVRVRNVSKEAIRFQYVWAFFAETPPTVKDGEGRPVTLGPFPNANGLHVPRNADLEPGKEIELYELKLRPSPVGDVGVRTPRKAGPEAFVERLYGTGKVRIQYERLAPPDTDRILNKLATGQLELEIKPDPPAEDNKL